jgi:hypothetical protein
LHASLAASASPFRRASAASGVAFLHIRLYSP